MLSKQEQYRQSVIVGWIMLLQVVLVMFIISILRGAVKNDFSGFAKDPGIGGTNIMIIVFAIYAILPVLLRAMDYIFLRWFTFAISIFFLLFFIAHQLTHMIVDNMPLNLYHVLDFTHHGIILWVIVCSFKWAKCKDNV
ncbi:MAG: hypothetical protein V4660_11855 [Pseudomonadota bacterium]